MGGMRGESCRPFIAGDAKLTEYSPGRFFVAHELKMVIAHLLLNYDIAPFEGERPKPKWVGATIIPPVEVTIKVKRRKGTVPQA